MYRSRSFYSSAEKGMFTRAVLALVLTLFSLPSNAQGYPSKPIRLIVPWAPTGTVAEVLKASGARLE